MRKGFTLIEILLTISITAIFMTLVLFSTSNYNRVKNELDMEVSENSVIGMINYSKQLCREKGKPGFVLFDLVRNEVDFYINNKKIDSFVFPKGVVLYDITIPNYRVIIDEYGFTSSSGRIFLRDNKGKESTILINIGTGYAEIEQKPRINPY